MGLCVGLSVKSHLTSGASVHLENSFTYSTGNGGQKFVGFSLELLCCRDPALPLLNAIRTVGHFAHEHYSIYHVVSGQVVLPELPYWADCPQWHGLMAQRVLHFSAFILQRSDLSLGVICIVLYYTSSFSLILCTVPRNVVKVTRPSPFGVWSGHETGYGLRMLVCCLCVCIESDT